jgi:serine/threonine protein kinase
MPGDVLGTLRYMSPEQALGEHSSVDHRTDIYSLGVTLYELLTLEPVFTGKDRPEILSKIADKDPRPPKRINEAVPTDLETIVLTAIAKEPKSRYATAQEMADDLRRFLNDKPIKAKRPTLIARAIKWRRRHRALALAAVIVIIGTILNVLLVLPPFFSGPASTVAGRSIFVDSAA